MKKEIIEINKELGGTLRNSNSLDYAEEESKDEKNIYKKVAYFTRAIIVDHPFSDMNKSTATIFAIREFRKHNIFCKEESLMKGFLKIAKKNITNLDKIEKGLRKWCLKKK